MAAVLKRASSLAFHDSDSENEENAPKRPALATPSGLDPFPALRISDMHPPRPTAPVLALLNVPVLHRRSRDECDFPPSPPGPFLTSPVAGTSPPSNFALPVHFSFPTTSDPSCPVAVSPGLTSPSRLPSALNSPHALKKPRRVSFQLSTTPAPAAPARMPLALMADGKTGPGPVMPANRLRVLLPTNASCDSEDDIIGLGWSFAPLFFSFFSNTKKRLSTFSSLQHLLCIECGICFVDDFSRYSSFVWFWPGRTYAVSHASHDFCLWSCSGIPSFSCPPPLSDFSHSHFIWLLPLDEL
jgi:hypothetical protein